MRPKRREFSDILTTKILWYKKKLSRDVKYLFQDWEIQYFPKILDRGTKRSYKITGMGSWDG